MFKKERGITLVALVVTVIILLILAGVTLSLALSETGIFNRTKNAVDKYKSTAEDESTQVNQFYKTTDNLLTQYGIPAE